MTNTVELYTDKTYAVALQGDNISLFVDKIYAVSLLPPQIDLFTYKTYAVADGNFTGEVYQDVSANRPVYRDAPSGGVPYVDMSGTSAALKFNVYDPGVYTIVLYKADQTFSLSTATFTFGENTLPITEDFNQAVIVKGDYTKEEIHRFALDAIKEGMEARVN